jgi:RNA polymerase sigma-70 factor (ECF subfamily)
MNAATSEDSESVDAPMNDPPSGSSKRGDPIEPTYPSRDREEVRARAERDRALVEAVQKGDRAAFRELYEAYHRRAFAVALGVVKNPDDARDIVQDAFIKVHKHIDGFQGSSSFYTWLYRIVMNLSIDQVRRSKKSKQVDYDDGVAREEVEAGGGAATAGLPRVNPGESALRRELSEAIQAALETLPEYHRAVIVLREVEGLSYEEMAEALEVPKGTIMSRLFHARRKMQEALRDYLGEDAPTAKMAIED